MQGGEEKKVEEKKKIIKVEEPQTWVEPKSSEERGPTYPEGLEEIPHTITPRIFPS